MAVTSGQDRDGSILVLVEDVMVPVSVVYNAINILKKEGVEKLDPMIVTQASTQMLPVFAKNLCFMLKAIVDLDAFLAFWLLTSLRTSVSVVCHIKGNLILSAEAEETVLLHRNSVIKHEVGLTPVESASMDVVALICRSLEFPSDKLCGDISRVLKPGGTVLLSLSSQSVSKEKSTHDRKLLLAGFSDTQSFEAGHSIVITAKKPSWKVGSSFSIKKVAKSLPKVQIVDDSDLIDEDSLLTEEDLKKPQLPSVDDCEVGKTKKACKNCTCGRAEAETKVQLGPTAEQLNNPQSACGSCGLGDAFRCGTCPYKGLPPFKLGEKVTLSANFLDADI
ncbi:hypothetical protein RDI58_020640 [Solanum bulbocastanum]|uniref:Anamorsin homolog n=1 Tax=Solanum bulbocastanum TaxID=147425 RepID=A0AAN8Y7Y3_SOLBU